MNKKIKIAYLVSTLMRCGPTNQLYNLIKFLDRSKFEAEVITLSPEISNSLWGKFEELGISLQSLNLTRIKGVVLARRKIRSLVKKMEIDIIHSSGIRADSLAVKLDGCKIISTLRNYPFADCTTKFGRLKGNLIARYHLGLLKRADVPVTVSNAVRTKLKSVCGVEFRVVENGVDRQIYGTVAGDSDKRCFRERLGLPLDSCLFVVTGALTDLKNPKMLIEAFKTSSLAKDCCLFFLGDGPLMESCKKKAGASGNIFFKGYVNNVIDYLKAADFYISASKSEGLPNAVLEAMSCGRPCLLSNIEPHIEIIIKNQQAGMLFDLSSVRSLVETVATIKSNDYKTMSDSASTLAGMFDARTMSIKYQNLYKSILAQ